MMNELQKIIDNTEDERLKFINYYNKLSTAEKKAVYWKYKVIDGNFSHLINQLNLLLNSENEKQR